MVLVVARCWCRAWSKPAAKFVLDAPRISNDLEIKDLRDRGARGGGLRSAAFVENFEQSPRFRRARPRICRRARRARTASAKQRIGGFERAGTPRAPGACADAEGFAPGGAERDSRKRCPRKSTPARRTSTTLNTAAGPD